MLDYTTVSAGFGGRRPTILFVDDDGDIRSMMTRSLTRAGFRVIAADCKESAVEAARYGREAPDVVLVELVGAHALGAPGYLHDDP